jgi:glycerol-3-phosphate cytidylyltransferase
MKKKRVLVDMSASIIHHGHIRLLKKAKKYGKVIVALTTDNQIKKYKGFIPELKFLQRKEILKELRCVDKIIPSKWLISQSFLDKNKIDIIISGSDYTKRKFKTKSINFPRTRGISSSIIRKKFLNNNL